MKGWCVIDELERMWKEAVVASFKVLSRHLPAETEDNHENPIRIVSLRAEIWILDLPNVKQDC
jgi:hypothetical protein